MSSQKVVFISYSHKDEEWKERLATHLNVLKHQYLLDFWEDSQIGAGADWLAAIDGAIATANVAVLLISAHSLTSTFILNEEIRRLLQRRKHDGLHIVPVIVKPCAWEAVDWLAQLQVLPRNGRPLSAGTEHQIDVDLTNIAREVNRLATSAVPHENGVETSAASQSSSSDRLSERYEFVHDIYEGHYSKVTKYRIRSTGEVCVIKDTDATRVNTKALHLLRDMQCPNIALPRVIWEHGGRVFEELPYVGGVRLSKAVARGLGGLSGAVLESFCGQIWRTLRRLHAAGVVHRDIHPDNIYLTIVRPGDSTSGEASQMIPAWNYDGFGGADGFLLAWVIVDCTFATTVQEAGRSPVTHGPTRPKNSYLQEPCPPVISIRSARPSTTE